MENELLEKLINIPQLKVLSVEYEDKIIRVKCEQKVHQGTCPMCQKRITKVHQYSTREVRDLDISGRKVLLEIRVGQLVCEDCHGYFNELLDFVEPNKGYTKRQAKWIFELSAKQPFTEVGAILDIHAKTVERIYYRQIATTGTSRYVGVKRIGIDEISFSKGKKDYLCVITDLDTGAIIDILRNRKKSELKAHFEGLSINGHPFCEQILGVSCDFWGPFQDLAKTLFPNATLVGDRFHWTMHLNESLNKLLKCLKKEHPKDPKLKNIKWLLFKQPAHLTDVQAEQLETAFMLCPLLKQFYEHKNTLQTLFEQEISFEQATDKMRQWIVQAKELAKPYFSDFVEFLEKHFDPIANFFKQKISNAVTEGNNNLIRSVKRMTFNMTNFAHFKARCFAFKT